MSVEMRKNSSLQASQCAALLGSLHMFFILCLFALIIFIQSRVSFDPSSVCLCLLSRSALTKEQLWMCSPLRAAAAGERCILLTSIADGLIMKFDYNFLPAGDPLALISVVQMLPVPGEASLTGSSPPTNRSSDMSSKMVEGAKLACSPLLFFISSVMLDGLPPPSFRFSGGPCGTCPPVIMSCDDRQIVRY